VGAASKDVPAREHQQYGSSQQEGFTINGSMSFQITLK
jgi:hypothetical protein